MRTRTRNTAYPLIAVAITLAVCMSLSIWIKHNSAVSVAEHFGPGYEIGVAQDSFTEDWGDSACGSGERDTGSYYVCLTGNAKAERNPRRSLHFVTTEGCVKSVCERHAVEVSLHQSVVSAEAVHLLEGDLLQWDNGCTAPRGETAIRPCASRVNTAAFEHKLDWDATGRQRYDKIMADLKQKGLTS